MKLSDRAQIYRATNFAYFKHSGQKRKYTGEPYVHHCGNVAALVESVDGSPDMICAAWLHDTLEDTDTLIAELVSLFGSSITCLVHELTDHFTGVGNRAIRKVKECERLAGISAEGQTIKLADLIDNTSSIVDNDPKFAKVYLKEKAALLKVLRNGDQRLLIQAQEIVANSLAALSK